MQVYVEKIQKGAHCLIYGAGVAGHYLAGRFKNFGVIIDAFIDPDESKGPVDEQTGIKVITEKDLAENKALYSDETLVISYPVKPVADEIRKRLIDVMYIHCPSRIESEPSLTASGFVFASSLISSSESSLSERYTLHSMSDPELFFDDQKKYAPSNESYLTA